MPEVADDVDNNCRGTCQGNVGFSCNVVDYEGDGKNDFTNTKTDLETGEISGCGNAVNVYGRPDNFCQMVDDMEYNHQPKNPRCLYDIHNLCGI